MSTTTTNADRTTRRSARLALGATAAGLLLAGVATTSPRAAAMPDYHELPPPDRYGVPCTIDPSMLPQTADAASAWLATCCQTDELPRTPDSTVAWLR